ncbi:hypothetical protein [Robertkochia sediminum]|uniref:hypothetical protein n=1 Tax=Robertkochia sediminum TaxID=2785326 RepID=UPI00193147EF|nr:hypothetical protein [Robertkochia sediminum]MBL7473188.1 hypothetical protein [Robertkochia sediminum]
MNKQDPIEQLFTSLEGQFDTEMPAPGHEARFLKKLQDTEQSKAKERKRPIWTIVSIAASIALILTVGLQIVQQNNSAIEADPEFAKTENYFASVLKTEIEKLEAENDPIAKKLVDDTMLQLGKLEADYAKLKEAVDQPGDQKLILHAMITNFQTRINLLQDVLNKIEEIKNLKNDNYENHVI